jgi:hypothetical protein
MLVYKVMGRTNPFDWAAPCEDEVIAYYQTKESADKQIEILKSRSDWRMNYSKFFVLPVEVLP